MVEKTPGKGGAGASDLSRSQESLDQRHDEAEDALRRLSQSLVFKSKKSFLGTHDDVTGHPLVSLVLVATDGVGQPIFLLSRLARHTHNLLKDPRVSALYDGTGANDDAMAGDRITVFGKMVAIDGPDERASARERFLSCHPTADKYVDFADFNFYKLIPDMAHLVGGFGRIVEISGHDLLAKSEDS